MVKLGSSINKKLKKRSSKNVIVGLLYQVISISLGLILPYLFITELGSETNGLMNSVTQVFTCLGLLEAGVGQATIQALYKPISESNKDEINGVMAATSHYYNRTGLYYAIAVALLVAFYPYVLNTKIDHLTIRLVILLQGAGSVISYSVQAKFSLLLSAEGKGYITRTLLIITTITRNIGKIIAISAGYGIIMVQAIQLFTVVVEASFIVIYMKRNYKWLDLKHKPNYQSISSKSYALINSVAWTVFNHSDILVLTLFARDLTLVSVYSVYLLIFEAGYNILEMIVTSYQYKIGAEYQNDRISFECYFTKFCTIVISLCFAIFSVLYLIAPCFVKLYAGSVTDADYLIFGVSELFFVYKILYTLRTINRQVITVNGEFKQTAGIVIRESIVNLAMSILLVLWFGIIGVLIGSAFSLLISLFEHLKYLYSFGLRNLVRSECKLFLISTPIVILVLIIGMRRVLSAQGWLQLALLGISIGIVSIVIYGSVMLLHLRREKKVFGNE